MNCENCAYYIYDEDWEEYVCDARMDEDDYQRLSQNDYRGCPYFRNGDEYKIAAKQ